MKHRCVNHYKPRCGGKWWEKEEAKAGLTNPQLLFQGGMGPLGRLDPDFPGVTLQAAAAAAASFPDLHQPRQKEGRSWQALSAIHLEKRQVPLLWPNWKQAASF